LLFLLRIPYISKEGYEFMNKLAEAISYYSMEESVALAKARGAFPLFSQTDYVKGKIPVAGYYEIPREHHAFDWGSLIMKIQKHGIRNSWTTTIAPTGTLSMIADTSNGIEPIFAVVFEKRVTVGKFFYTNRIFENILMENGLYDDEILTTIASNYGSVRDIEGIPSWIQKIFVTAIDIHWADHLMAQAVWQKWISNAIAKTINMPGDATADDIKSAYLLAHELGLKGVTVYRDGSRHEQVLHITGDTVKEKSFKVNPSVYVLNYIRDNVKEPLVREQITQIFKDSQDHESEDLKILQYEEKQQTASVKKGSLQASIIETYENPCPSCKARLIVTEGCNMCIECGFSSCGSG
jgi:ribonucleoside-diphosphate reductase alpha chain